MLSYRHTNGELEKREGERKGEGDREKRVREEERGRALREERKARCSGEHTVCTPLPFRSVYTLCPYLSVHGVQRTHYSHQEHIAVLRFQAHACSSTDDAHHETRGPRLLTFA